jgi:GT2 family glycosyltransferase
MPPAAYKVSAIVSVYKSRLFIEGKLRDLLNQTLGEQLEIIFIDSNSPEDEADSIQQAAAAHPNIKYLRTAERETIYQAWNRGLVMAQGEYITNANCDDRLRPDALAVLAAVLDAEPQVMLVYGDYFISNHANSTFYDHIRTGQSTKPEYAPDIMLNGCHMGPQPMWRKSVHDVIGLFDGALRSAGDYEFWCRMAAQGMVLRHVPDYLGLYYHNPAGMVNANQMLSDQETNQIKQQYQGKLPAGKTPPPVDKYFRASVASGRFVNICMVTYNRLAFTMQALDALVHTTRYPYTLTVVDNGSSDGTRAYLQEQRRRGIIKNLVLLDTNLGVAPAANIGWLMEPEAAYYLKLDNDIVVQKPEWLDQMVTTIDTIQMAGAVAYSFEPVSYPLQRKKGLPVRLKRTGNLGGACILVPQRTREQLGYWNEEYGLYGEEDADYGYRIRRARLLNLYMADESIGLHLPAGRAATIDRQTRAASDGQEENEDREYRIWKDGLRRQILGSGQLERNQRAYRDATKSLYYTPSRALDFIRAHYPAVAARCAPPLPFRQSRLSALWARLRYHWDNR